MYNRFSMDIEDVDTNEYMKQIILGGRQFCMKEPLSTLPKARMQLKMYNKQNNRFTMFN